MKLIIAGSRSFNDYERLKKSMERYLETVLDSEPYFDNIISGHATGADRLGERFATEFDIPLKIMPADWDYYGRRAGHIRNQAMAKIATHCIVFWDRQSPGTRDMINCARAAGLKLRIVCYTTDIEIG